MPTLEEIIRKHVLKNAFDFGRANPGSVAGKVIADYPDAKKDMKSTMGKINKIVGEVSKLSKSEIEEQMLAFTYVKKEEKKKGIELPGAEQGKVVTRFPPEPAGFPHIGHAKAAWIDYEGARAYDGKMVLRFDDTNPGKASNEYVEAIKEGLAWLGVKWVEETFTSDKIDEIYAFATKLVKDGNAYVCTCTQEQISEGRTKCKPCACREMSKEEHLERWNGMLDTKYEEGKALLRFKGDLESDNTVMRDPALARIINKTHYRTGDKYKVWPGYDLAVVVMDHLEGITHPMRTKEYELRNELYYAIFRALDLPEPKLIEFARLSIKNAPVGKRLIRPLVEEGKVMGWDDPRLPTLAGLKRRGLLPEAIKRFVLSFGLSKVESEPDWEVLLSENRKLLDPESDHYFFVEDPVKVVIKGLKGLKVKLKLHPKKDKGFRELEVRNTVYISGKDAKALKPGEIFRLKDLCNVKLIGKADVIEAQYAGDSMVPKKLQWVSEDYLECEVLKPGDLLTGDGEYDKKSLQTVKGFCEAGCRNLKQSDIIQFERFGFCRLDSNTKMLTFIYSC